ncbi:hypothetical protein JMM61_14120 [Rhodovulum sulfidophilum]|uniref:DUF6339 family protein n=1 Tax=Rhodovulum sulfidophilum TaxID=35806 RepID=UPI0019257821|nr:DUF6339 family protein [Rhodovulum sulfidophilum]MBL3586514.1 hypothetical protein [Rhodovulum sulfidophilum]MCE8438359.1 hypothetical protein [Rhodovulum sulfidophilum]MCE8470350.1 hypothetical protein [Rhodovulum sulfidophilum]
MTGTKLLPRLSPIGVDKCLADIAAPGDGRLRPGSGLDHRLKAYDAHLWYAASGGSVDSVLVAGIMDRIAEIARDCGFPDPATDRRKSDFDKQVAAYFGQHPELSGGEPLRDDVWAFMSCVLLQEFVIWRYSAGQKARFAGGVRNTFQRLWMRGRTLDLGEGSPDRWRLLNALSEDAMVQIFERASIAGDARLSRAIAECWISTSERIGRGKMEDVMRRATKLVRLRNQVLDLAFLPEDRLAKEISAVFDKVAEEAGNARGDQEDPPMISRITRAIFKARKGGTAFPT